MDAALPGRRVRSLDADGRAAARGDLEAFERLYRGSVAGVHGLARRMLGPARADEVTQEVYLRAWRGLRGWRAEAGIETWLRRIALHLVLDHVRATRPETAGPEALEGLEARGAKPSLELEEAIAALPAGARAVFVLHDVEGFTHEEIAARLGLAVGTSKSQLHRARMLLRASLGKESTE